MSCLDVLIPGALVNAGSLPFAENDAMISPGTLLLIEPGHPVTPTAGVPAQPAFGTNTNLLTFMPNVASRPALVLCDALPFGITGSISNGQMTVTVAGSKSLQIGSGISGTGIPAGTYIRSFGSGKGGTGTYNLSVPTLTAASQALVVTPTVQPLFNRNDTPTSAGVPLSFAAERSAKGGLHVVSSQATQTASAYARFELPGPVKAYMAANQSHVFYLSAWYQITRADLVNTGPYIFTGDAASNLRGFFGVKRDGPLFAPNALSKVATGARNTVGLVHEELATSYVGAVALADDAPGFHSIVFGFGLVNAAYGDHARNKAMSAVVYRLFLEDLTVSGRSAAQLAAIDEAARTAAFAAGGRYAGDSWTAPGTLLP